MVVRFCRHLVAVCFETLVSHLPLDDKCDLVKSDSGHIPVLDGVNHKMFGACGHMCDIGLLHLKQVFVSFFILPDCRLRHELSTHIFC
jgi:hypothetical protein